MVKKIVEPNSDYLLKPLTGRTLNVILNHFWVAKLFFKRCFIYNGTSDFSQQEPWSLPVKVIPLPNNLLKNIA
jgi:hypothetical protein